MRQFTLLAHGPCESAPTLEMMIVRDHERARELATKRLRDSNRFERVQVWEGAVALFDISRADLS
jgi:hypothetical protein